MKDLSGGLLAEPEPDCRGRDGPVKDVGPLVVTGCDRPGVLEPVNGPLDLVATPVAVPVEAGGSATDVAAGAAIGLSSAWLTRRAPRLILRHWPWLAGSGWAGDTRKQADMPAVRPP